MKPVTVSMTLLHSFVNTDFRFSKNILKAEFDDIAMHVSEESTDIVVNCVSYLFSADKKENILEPE